MTRYDYLALAEHDERMARYCYRVANSLDGVVAAAIMHEAAIFKKSARLWREKAEE